jgi:hypothetical protein
MFNMAILKHYPAARTGTKIGYTGLYYYSARWGGLDTPQLKQRVTD